MKEYSLDKMTFIVKGGAGSIYRINDEQIIKIYNNISVKKLEERKHWARELFKAGVPTAISFETVVVGTIWYKDGKTPKDDTFLQDR